MAERAKVTAEEYTRRRAAALAATILPAPAALSAAVGPAANLGIIEEIARAYPKAVILPEHYEQHYGGKADNGNIVAPPAALTMALMNGLCPLTNDGRTKVGESHLLVYIPRTIGTNPFSIETMVAKDASLFWSNNDYGNQTIKEAQATESGWMLIPKIDCPGTRNLNLEQQEQVLDSFRAASPENRSYEEVQALPLVAALVMESLVHGQKSFVDFWARTATSPGASWRVVVGNFLADGMGVGGGCDDDTISLRGLALFRNLKNLIVAP